MTNVVFGAINHRATLWANGHKVGTQVTSYTPSVFDISRYARPGAQVTLKVRVEGRKALVGPDGRYTVAEGASWSDDVAQGIFRSAELQVFSPVQISDTFVRTSVKKRTVTYDVTLANATASRQRIRLGGRLSSWNHATWAYPHVPTRTVSVPAHGSRTVTVGPLAWRAGSGSYWWPNLPYRAGYRAQLHRLDLTATPVAPKIAPARSRVRFGFREVAQVGDHYELNGRRINFRGDSLQGANYDNIDHHGKGDAYDTLPGFLKPSRHNGGWPQAVDNYLRLNFSGVRIHQVPATPYMLDVADERGLMIQDETAIRGSNNRENFAAGRANMVKHLADLVKRDRNHASVLRWSQANEPQVAFFTNPGAGRDFDEALYRTVMSLDTTRPISTDSAIDSSAADLPHSNYTVFCHYDGFSFGKYSESICSGPAGKPQGQGEFLWFSDHTPQGARWFATASMRMREKGAADVRPYTLLDVWSSVIPGVRRTSMNIESGYPNSPHPLFGQDNLPHPWSNPTITLIQKAFNPLAAIDSDFWNANKLSDEAGTWPTTPAEVHPGPTTRALTVFNDTLHGTRLKVSWALHAGSPVGAVLDRGMLTPRIALGTHRRLPITFTVPHDQTSLYLELTVSKPGDGGQYHDVSTMYAVTAASAVTPAE